MIQVTENFTYQESQYDGVAQIDSVKGNTLVWNQLVNPSNYFSSLFRATKSINGNTVTLTDNRTSSSDNFGGASLLLRSIPVGHKVLVSFNITSLNVTDFYRYTAYLRNSNGTGASSTTYLTDTGIQKVILTATAEANQFAMNFYTSSATTGSTDTTVIKDIMVFDLTAMGLDITYPSDFTSLFPLPYYSYDSGSLLSFNGSGIKTTGKNLLPPSTEFSSVADITISADNGIYTLNGTPSAYRQAIATNSFVLEPGTYRFSKKASAINNNVVVQLRSTNGLTTYATASSEYGEAFTINDRIEVKFRITVNADAGTLNNFIIKPLLELGSTATSYEPYTTQTTDLPISTYFPTGMKSAGSVYDELVPTKATTRIGAVDLGSLTWFMASSDRFISTDIASVIKAPSSNTVKANILCAKYETQTYSGIVDSGLLGVGVNANSPNTGNVCIKDSSTYESADAFKTAMDGIYLYYELATPVETDINPPLNILYDTYKGGTEEILPANGSTPTTSAFFGDLKIYSQIEPLVPYRTFWLINGNGDRWDFTKHELKSFLNEPQGLGFQKTIGITRYGERAVKNSETYNFPTVSGDLLFYDTPNSTRYEKYNEFVRFLMNQPITLYYQIPVSVYSRIADIYTLDCEVTSLTKTESKQDKILSSAISMSGLGFYQGEKIEISGSGLTYTINNNGDFPVGFEIEINGSLTNPYFILEQSGEMYGEAKFDDSVAFDRVYIDSNDGEQNVVLEQGGSILPNPLSYQDLSISNGFIYVTFVKLPMGESTLTIGMDSGSVTSVSVKFIPTYRSV